MITFSQIIKISSLRNQPKKDTCIPTNSGGIYKWWCTKEDFKFLIDKINGINFGNERNYIISFSIIENYVEKIEYQENHQILYCIYVGQAKGQSLFSRIKNQHLNGNPKGSTVRLTLWGLLKDSSIFGKFDSHNENHKEFNRTIINNFLDKLYIQFAACETELIDEEERKEINKKNYIRILNGDDFSSDFEFEQNGGNCELRNLIKEKRKYARKH